MKIIPLSIEGWSQGILDIFTLFIGCTLGISLIYKSRKTRSHILFLAGLFIFFFGLSMLGVVYDFFTILLTGKNFKNLILLAYLTYMWMPILAFCGMYIGSELMAPQMKWYIISIYSVLSIIYTVIIFTDPMGNISFIYPKNPGETPVIPIFTFGTPVFYLMSIFTISGLIFLGFGFLYSSIKSAGIIRKRFLFLSLGFSLLWTGGIILPATVTDPPILPIIIVKIMWTSGLILFYIGFKIELTTTKTIPTHKETEHKKSKISLIETLSTTKPAEITEEEVSLFREQKICLICRGNVVGFDSFICKCDALYCENCARALANSENTCWACGTPIDESKPVKPFKKEEEIEISEKPQKKPKTNKK